MGTVYNYIYVVSRGKFNLLGQAKIFSDLANIRISLYAHRKIMCGESGDAVAALHLSEISIYVRAHAPVDIPAQKIKKTKLAGVTWFVFFRRFESANF